MQISQRLLTGRLFALLVVLSVGVARAAMPSVGELDANARAAGNLKSLAERIGDLIFATPWAAQVTQVSANGIDGHIIVGVRISGVKFHHEMSQADFESEVHQLIARAFAVAPGIEEVDIWASVPIVVGKDAIVSGDLAVPTSRPVFTLSVRRGVDPLLAHAFLDEDWARQTFKKDH